MSADRRSTRSTLLPPGPLPRPRRGRPACSCMDSRVTLCGCGALGRCWPTTWSGPASGHVRIMTATSSRRTTSSGRSSSTSRMSPRTCPRPRPPHGSCGDQQHGQDRAGRHRHRPHQHPRPRCRRRPDPRRHRKLRDPLPDQRCGRQAGQALGLRRRDRQRGADDDDRAGQDAMPALLIETAPPPGMTPTCETAGVLGPAVAVIASLRGRRGDQAAHGRARRAQWRPDHGRRLGLTFRQLKVARLLGKVDCPCCQHHNFEWLDGALGSHTTTLCGRNAVQVATRRAEPLELPRDGRPLAPLGEVRDNAFMLRFATEGYEFTVFPTAARSSRGRTTSPRRGPCIPSSWGAEAEVRGGSGTDGG